MTMRSERLKQALRPEFMTTLRALIRAAYAIDETDYISGSQSQSPLKMLGQDRKMSVNSKTVTTDIQREKTQMQLQPVYPKRRQTRVFSAKRQKFVSFSEDPLNTMAAKADPSQMIPEAEVNAKLLLLKQHAEKVE